MILGRTVRAVHAESISPIRPSRLTKIFVAGDITCFLVQAAGGGITASSSDASKEDLGKAVILAGLALQITLFGLFVAVAFVFHTRLRKQPTEMSQHPEIRWLTMLNVLYCVSAFIMIRNLFRIIEYAGGRDGYLLSNEWPLYVFDTALMAGSMALLLRYFPTLIRPKILSQMQMDTLECQPLSHN